MSVATTLRDVAEAIEQGAIELLPGIEAEAVKLLALVFTSPDPKRAARAAMSALAVDAANEAADEALRKLLPSPPQEPT